MKIGIVGGTFDPIHNGHLMLGEYAYRQYELDEVWYMPNGNPPHKSNVSISSDVRDRVNMVELSIIDKPYFKLQPYEVEHKEVHYSYQTMEYFNQAYPGNQFYFVIGADSLFHIEKWVHPERLLKECMILAAYRDEKTSDEMTQQISYLNKKYDADIRLLNTPNVDISSSEIRRKLDADVSVQEYVPAAVHMYLRVKETIPTKRFTHTLGVMNTAKDLAKHYQQNTANAMLAGLLHDCAKGIPAGERISLCEQYGLKVSEAERMNTELLHAKLGCYLAEVEYGISDREILEAILYHTTGRPKMTFLDKIIYIADYIEPGRKEAPNLAKIRELAYVDIDRCLVTILEQTISYLKTRKEVIDPMTEQTYYYYKENLNV